jgi:activator of HSP90 ATPase
MLIPIQISLTPDSPFELFGGNIRGKVVSAEAPIKLVQTWQPRMPNWPVEHYGTLTVSLKQGSDATDGTSHRRASSRYVN